MEYRYELNKSIKIAEKSEYAYDRELSHDMVLPDYCDDINRIIRVDAKPIIKNKYVSGGSLKTNGSVAATIVYISDPAKKLKSFSFPIDFDYDFPADNTDKGHHISMDIAVGELNCKLLNPRKLSLKIQNYIMIKAYSGFNAIDSQYKAEETFDMEVEVLKHTVRSAVTLIGEGETKISENITVQTDMAANEIIYADVNILIDDIKPIYNKAVIKFTADIKCLYSTASPGENEEYAAVSKRIPSTVIIDIDDIDEKFECIAKATLSSLKVDIDTDSYGENKIITVEFIVGMELKAYCNNEEEIIIDAYSPKYENTVINATLNTEKFKGVYREKFEIEDSIILEDLPLAEVCDISGLAVINEAVINGSSVSVTANAEMSVMVINSERELQNLDCSIPLKNEINISEVLPNGICECYANITDMRAVVESGKLTVNITIVYECVILHRENCIYIKSLEVDTEKVKNPKKDVQMILYYPAKNETLWSIAKKYNTSMEKIARRNKCEGSCADSRIIVIPM